MDANELTEVCRLCPSISTPADSLLDVFDSGKNMKEVILVTTGIEITETEFISKKICQKCMENVLHIQETRQTAIIQNQLLQAKYEKAIAKGLRLSNSCITIKKDKRPPLTDVPGSVANKPTQITGTNPKPSLNASIIEIFRNNPTIKVPKKSITINWTPTVSLLMGEVESHMKKFKIKIARRQRNFARKKTAIPVKSISEILNPKIVVFSFTKSEVFKKLQPNEQKLISQQIHEREKEASEKEPSEFYSMKTLTTLSPSSISSTVKRRPIISDDSEPPAKIRITVQTNSSPIKTSHPSSTKPAFIQSLGLTPASDSPKQKICLTCKICGVVHNNVTSLKIHTSRHRVCPYCREKFKNTDVKQKHIDQLCEVRKITESKSFVILGKIDLDVDVRRTYRTAFRGFDPIEGVEDEDNVILLSDEDNDVPPDRRITAEVASETPSMSVSTIVRPIVKIYQNVILNNIPCMLADRAIVKKLMIILKKFTGQIREVNTRPISSRELTISNGICRIRRFKGDLLSYVIPIDLKKGNFSVNFKSTSEYRRKETLAHWDNSAFIEKRTRNAKPKTSMLNYPMTFQMQSSHMSLSSIQVMTTPGMSIFLPNSSTFIPTITNSPNTNNQTINNTFYGPISGASIQGSPVMQNYTLSMPMPIINNQVQIQSSNNNSQMQNSDSSNTDRSDTSESKFQLSCSEVPGKLPVASKAQRTPIKVKHIWDWKQ